MHTQLPLEPHRFELCGPLRHEFFSTVNVTVPHDSGLAESAGTQALECEKLTINYMGIFIAWRVSAPNLSIVQGSTVYTCVHTYIHIHAWISIWSKAPLWLG